VTVILLEGGYASTAIAPIEVFHSAGRLWHWLRGETLAENTRMQDLARKLGFELKTGPGVVEMRLPLHSTPVPAA